MAYLIETIRFRDPKTGRFVKKEIGEREPEMKREISFKKSDTGKFITISEAEEIRQEMEREDLPRIDLFREVMGEEWTQAREDFYAFFSIGSEEDREDMIEDSPSAERYVDWLRARGLL